MFSKSIILAGAITAMVTSPVLAQRKAAPTSNVNIQIPQSIRHLLANPKAMQLITLTAECEVIQASKTAWKPPYYNYRTGGIAFRMGGNASSTHYVAVHGTPTQLPANVPQPNRSETFAAGKLTTGVLYDDPNNGIIISIESDNLKQGNIVHVPVAGGSGGVGVLADIYNGSQPTGYYRWQGTLSCPAGFI